MRFAAFSVAYLLATMSDPATAESIQACTSFQDDKDRLSCYDKAAGFQPKVSQENAKSVWRFREKMDEFSNKNTSYIYLVSDAVDDRGSDKPGVLYVRCNGAGQVDIFVASNGYIGGRNDSVPVRYKFGNDDPIRERWSESTDGNAAFLPNAYQDFRQGLLSGRDFIFELTDFRGSTHSATFANSKPNSDQEKFVFNGCK